MIMCSVRKVSRESLSRAERALRSVEWNFSSTIARKRTSDTIFSPLPCLLLDFSQVTCCGADGLFPGEDVLPGKNSATRSVSMDLSGHSSCKRRDSRYSSDPRYSSDLMLQSSSSLEGSPVAQRKRPLAVAVGFKYAEDINGRPIIITPGNRRMPVQGSKTSPASHPGIAPTRETASADLFSFHHDPDRPQQHVSCNPSSSS